MAALDLVVTMSRHRTRPRNIAGMLLWIALLLFLLAGAAWALMQAHNDCLAGRLPGPWC